MLIFALLRADILPELSSVSHRRFHQQKLSADLHSKQGDGSRRNALSSLDLLPHPRSPSDSLSACRIKRKWCLSLLVPVASRLQHLPPRARRSKSHPASTSATDDLPTFSCPSRLLQTRFISYPALLFRLRLILLCARIGPSRRGCRG